MTKKHNLIMSFDRVNSRKYYSWQAVCNRISRENKRSRYNEALKDHQKYGDNMFTKQIRLIKPVKKKVEAV